MYIYDVMLGFKHVHLHDEMVDWNFSLYQVSQYTFAMCSYREKKPDPTEMMQLDGFTVDYCEQIPGEERINYTHDNLVHEIYKTVYHWNKYLLKIENWKKKLWISDAEVFGGKHFFNCVKEGDNVTFATDDENERTLWVQAIYRATGQTHKPVPPVVQTNKISNTQISRMQGGKFPINSCNGENVEAWDTGFTCKSRVIFAFVMKISDDLYMNV